MPIAAHIMLERITQAGPLWDEIQEALRNDGHEGLAQRVLQLETDAGNEYAHGTWTYESGETFDIETEFQPVTPQRLGHILSAVHDDLTNPALKQRLEALAASIEIALDGVNSEKQR